jgi:hypothetical protein
MFGDLRGGVIFGEKNIRKRFVVAHQDVEARLHLLDVIGLEQKRFRLRFSRDENHGSRERDHPRDAVGVARGPHIARDAFSDAFGFTDIKHFAIGPNHAVDASPAPRHRFASRFRPGLRGRLLENRRGKGCRLPAGSPDLAGFSVRPGHRLLVLPVPSILGCRSSY